MPSEAQTKACPKCGEQIPSIAVKCKHCGSDLRSWPARHKILSAILVLMTFPFIMVAITSTKQAINSTTPPAPLSPEEIAKQKAEQETFDKSPAGVLCKKHPTWTKEDCTKVADDKIWVGMSLEMLVEENGKPNTNNISNYGNGNRHQYCWNGFTPSCYYDNNSDGIIDAYN